MFVYWFDYGIMVIASYCHGAVCVCVRFQVVCCGVGVWCLVLEKWRKPWVGISLRILEGRWR